MRRPALSLVAIAVLTGCGAGGKAQAPLGDPDPAREQVRQALLQLGVHARAGDRTFRIRGRGMEPALRMGERVIVRPYGDRRPARGEVVAYRSRRGRDTCGDGIRLARVARAVSAGYVVLGDNRAVPCDSRSVGPVGRGEVVGQAIAVYWPPERVRRVN